MIAINNAVIPMKNKTKNIIAVIAIILVFAVGYLVFGGGLQKLRDGGSKPIVLEVDFDQAIQEDASESPLKALGLDDSVTLQDTLAALEAGSKDERVKVLVARIGTGTMGFAQRQDVRDAIARFRKAGKKAYAFSETFGEVANGTGNYYLATAFDKIFLQPAGDVGLTGMIAETQFLRGTLEKLDVGVRGGHRHEYKNAFNTFTESKMTPAHREAMEALMQSFQQQIVLGIAQGRKMSPEQVQTLIDNGPYLAQQAVEAGLVDKLQYRDEVYDAAKDEAGKDARLLYLRSYLKKRGNPYKKGETIAVIYGVGGVQRGESSNNPLTGANIMGSDTVSAAFRAAADDDKVKAIIFRVDCPGGSYVASDTILREVARARKKGKPVVVTMGNVAASGGYFVALSADRVLAQPGTITGSIGVLNLKFLTNGLWGKAGVTWDSAQMAKNANMWSSHSDYTPEQFAKFNAWLDRVYDEFTTMVANGRKLPKERVLEIAKGRVWSGQDAVALGLVDELGGFNRAIEVAREVAKISADDDVKLVRFPKSKTLLDQLSGEKPENSERAAIHALVKAVAPLRPAMQLVEKMNEPAGANVMAMPDTEIVD